MDTLSLLKKNRKRFISNKKAFSSIVGGLLAAIIIISLFSALFVWSFNQNAKYNNAVTQKNQLISDQQSERLLVLQPPVYTEDTASLTNGIIRFWNVTAENRGTNDLQIIRVLIKNLDIATNIGSKDLSLTLKSGNTTVINATDFKIPINYTSGNRFVSWLVTARGNVISTIPISIGQEGPRGAKGDMGPEALNAVTAQGIGSLSFGFDTLTYFTVNNGQLTPYPNGIQSYKIPVGANNQNIALGFNVTNVNPAKKNYTLSYQTIIWSYFAGVPGQTLGPVWSIVNNESATISSTYNKPITLAYNVSTFIIFARQNNKFDQSQIGAIAAINLIFYGNFTTTNNGVTTPISPYGQNVPFVSLQFTS